jgi:uncharacterized protein YndB with AHSA1/START domain
VPSFTRSIVVRRSPEQVFAVLDDLEQAPQWMPAIRRIDILTPGMRMGAGFKWRETRRIFGVFPFKVVLTVVAHHQPETWGLMFNDGKVQATATFELAALPAGTQVTFVEEVEDLQGKPGRAERTMRRMEKQDDDLLDRLKAHVERTTEEPAGLVQDAPVLKPARASKPKSKARKPTKDAKASIATKAKAASGKSAAKKRGAGKPK